MNDKVPLSVGLAKEASDLELNPEQIRRGVEAVNNITYLKILQISPDRTVEFPLCKYAEVIDELGIPDMPSAYLGAETEAASLVEKVASAEEVVLDAPEHLLKARLLKAAMVNRRDIEDLETRALHIRDDIVSSVGSIQGDASGLDKLASVCEDEEFKALSKLVTGSEAQARHTPEGFFKTASLNQVNSLRELYIDARNITQELVEKRALQERIDVLVKQAFIGAATGFVGRMAGKVVGGTVKAPFKYAGRVVKKTYDTVSAPLKSTRDARLATQTSKLGRAKVVGGDTLKSVSSTSKIIGSKAAKKIGAITTVASGPLIYTPGTNSVTGAPIDAFNKVKTY